MLVYIVAGEASGDALGAGLMHALKTKNPEIKFAGIGGEAMCQAGLQSLFPYNELSLMGFLEILPHIPKILRRLKQTLADIAAKKPDVIVTIDSPGFNFRLAKLLKNNPQTTSIKRVHYVAPTVWAYKPERAKKTAELFDELLVILPFEPPYFAKEGLKTTFVGHPVLAKKVLEKNISKKTLLILPGSRSGEVKRHLPIFLEAAKSLPDYKIIILASPQVKSLIESLTPQGVKIADINEKNEVFSQASLAISKSGTITLELAANHIPMVVAHKVNVISAWLIRRMMLINFASLVNIAVNKEIVPELLQEHCNSQEISQAVVHLDAQKQLQEIDIALKILRGDGEESPSELAAQAILT